MQDERSTSTRKNIRFNNDLLEAIEKVMGTSSFSGWVQDACREKLKGNNKVTGK